MDVNKTVLSFGGGDGEGDVGGGDCLQYENNLEMSNPDIAFSQKEKQFYCPICFKQMNSSAQSGIHAIMTHLNDLEESHRLKYKEQMSTYAHQLLIEIVPYEGDMRLFWGKDLTSEEVDFLREEVSRIYAKTMAELRGKLPEHLQHASIEEIQVECEKLMKQQKKHIDSDQEQQQRQHPEDYISIVCDKMMEELQELISDTKQLSNHYRKKYHHQRGKRQQAKEHQKHSQPQKKKKKKTETPKRNSHEPQPPPQPEPQPLLLQEQQKKHIDSDGEHERRRQQQQQQQQPQPQPQPQEEEEDISIVCDETMEEVHEKPILDIQRSEGRQKPNKKRQQAKEHQKHSQPQKKKKKKTETPKRNSHEPQPPPQPEPQPLLLQEQQKKHIDSDGEHERRRQQQQQQQQPQPQPQPQEEEEDISIVCDERMEQEKQQQQQLKLGPVETKINTSSVLKKKKQKQTPKRQQQQRQQQQQQQRQEMEGKETTLAAAAAAAAAPPPQVMALGVSMGISAQVDHYKQQPRQMNLFFRKRNNPSFCECECDCD